MMDEMAKPLPAGIVGTFGTRKDKMGGAPSEAAVELPSADLSEDRAIEAVDRAIRERQATRNFAPTSVARRTVEEILDVARFAPSGANTQPWTVYVLGGRVKPAMSESLSRAHSSPARDSYVSEYAYYSSEMPEQKQQRRDEFGRLYYGSLGIRIDDIEGRLAQTGKNYSFFGAPIGLIFTIDRRLEKGSWLDMGMFIQNVMLAATARGLATCPQAAFAKYHALIRTVLEIPDEEIVVCGMSLGYAAPDSSIPRMPRAQVSDFAIFLGFDQEAKI
jgi:nitroreductase